MRKLALILAAMMPLLVSCSKNETIETIETPKLCTVALDYALPSSGSMSRSGDDLYAKFYNEQIVTRKITPSFYNLTFTNTEDNSTVEIVGQWSKSHGLKLLAGTYKVTGTSHPKGTAWNGALDTLSLRFEEDIKITPETDKIQLKATYDSFMVFFDSPQIKSIKYGMYGYSGYSSNLSTVGDIKYMFDRNLDKETYLFVLREDGGTAYVNIGEMKLENGKYYYFGDTETEYDLPGMEAGN